VSHPVIATIARQAAASALLLAFALLALVPVQVARADGAATIFGFVSVDDRGALPTKIRVLGPALPGRARAVCGTADVIRSGDGAGFYLLTVLSSASREGCPRDGQLVTFLLLYGAVDPGIEAGQSAVFAAGSSQQVDLSPFAESIEIGGFTGSLPVGGGYALLYWHGPDHTPVEHAVRAILREVQVVFRIAGQGVKRYIVNAPAFVNDLRELHHGDVVVVLVK